MIYSSKARRKTVVPYGLLTNIELLIDARGLATNTTNAYGAVDGSNVITAIESAAPGATGRSFSVVGSGVTYDPSDRSIAFNGSGRLRSTSAASVWDFLSYNATLANLKWTAFILFKVNTVTASSYGILGNNGGSSANKGMTAGYAGAANPYALSAQITRGTGAQYVGNLIINAVAMQQRYFVWTIQYDGSLGANSKMRFWVNDQPLLFAENADNNTTPQTTPSFALEVGGFGNGVLPLNGNIKEIIVAREATSFLNVIAVQRALLNKHNIRRLNANLFDNTTTTQIFQQHTDSKYHLMNCLQQNPALPNRLLAIYNVADSHFGGSATKIVGRQCFNAKPGTYGVSTFSSQFDIFDPASSEFVSGAAGCYDPSGRFHLIAMTRTSLSPGGTLKTYYAYSDNDGTTFSTFTDITSSIASDGLLLPQPYGSMIYNNGALILPYYKATDVGDATQVANYCLKSTDLGVTWVSKTIRAPGSANINEMEIVGLHSAPGVHTDNLYAVVRNEGTGEWRVYTSADNGETWTDQGDKDWGESLTLATPVRLKNINHKGVPLIAWYMSHRNSDYCRVCYAKGSDLLSNPLTGWDLDTKFTWWQTSLSPNHLTYGDIVHIDGTPKAVSMYSYDPYPDSGSGLVNTILFTLMPTWQFDKVESELGL